MREPLTGIPTKKEPKNVEAVVFVGGGAVRGHEVQKILKNTHYICRQINQDRMIFSDFSSILNRFSRNFAQAIFY